MMPNFPLQNPVHRIFACPLCRQKNRINLYQWFHQKQKPVCGSCQASLFKEIGQPLSNLKPAQYQHPLDKKSLSALENIPGVHTILKKFVEATLERYDKLFNQSSFLQITPLQMPSLLKLLTKTAQKLGLLDIPDLYLYQSAVVNAYTSGVEKPYIAISSGLLDSLSEEELCGVLAHELAHIHSNHVLYKIAARILLYATSEIANATFGIGNVIALPLKVALLKWDRCSELTADRGMLLATQDPELCLKVLMKLTIGSPSKYAHEVSLVEFMKQAQQAQNAPEEGMLNQIYTIFQTLFRTHPFPLFRAAELWKFTVEGNYIDLLEAIS